MIWNSTSYNSITETLIGCSQRNFSINVDFHSITTMPAIDSNEYGGHTRLIITFIQSRTAKSSTGFSFCSFQNGNRRLTDSLSMINQFSNMRQLNNSFWKTDGSKSTNDMQQSNNSFWATDSSKLMNVFFFHILVMHRQKKFFSKVLT